MKIILVSILLLSSLYSSNIFFTPEEEKFIKSINNSDLSFIEKQYLLNKKVLNICYSDLDVYPIIIDSSKNSTPQGFSIDILNIIKKDLKLEYNYIYVNNFFEDFINLYCDITPVVSDLPRKEGIKLVSNSLSYISDHIVMISDIDAPYIYEIKDMKNKKIGINARYQNIIFYIRKLYPDLNLIELNNDGFEDIVDKKLDAIITTRMNATYHIDLKYAKKLKLMSSIFEKRVGASFGVKEGNEILLNIINSQS